MTQYIYYWRKDFEKSVRIYQVINKLLTNIKWLTFLRHSVHRLCSPELVEKNQLRPLRCLSVVRQSENMLPNQLNLNVQLNLIITRELNHNNRSLKRRRRLELFYYLQHVVDQLA